jgi:hypothetical protein
MILLKTEKPQFNIGAKKGDLLKRSALENGSNVFYNLSLIRSFSSLIFFIHTKFYSLHFMHYILYVSLTHFNYTFYSLKINPAQIFLIPFPRQRF